MKNSPTPAEDTSPAPEPSAAWRRALDLLDADLRRRGAPGRTRRAYAIDAAQFALWCGAQDLDPADVSPRTLRRYAATLSDRRAVAATVGGALAALRALYRALHREGVVAGNPADLVPSPERRRPLPRVLRPDEMAALLDRIPASTPLETRDRALFELAYASGLRAEELVALDVGSVDFEAEELRVEGRGGKTRIVPAGAPALKALARYVDRARPALDAGDGEPALFLSKSGRRLSTSDVRRRLRAWTRRAEVKGGVSPHTLRHSFATHLQDAGADLRAIEELMGRASISTSRIYTGVESARLKSAYAKSHPRA